MPATQILSVFRHSVMILTDFGNEKNKVAFENETTKMYIIDHNRVTLE